MDSAVLQLLTLAVIQALTEFLPVSSSAHLILPSQLWGWQDQGLAFDVAVHLGTLLAVIIYYCPDLVKIATYTIESALTFRNSPVSRVGWYLVLATLPAGVCGLLLEEVVAGAARSMEVIGWTTIIFGLLLGIASAVNRRVLWRNLRSHEGLRADSLRELTMTQALAVGCAQALALIPGTSRSGVTLTAGLFMGLRPEAAARFSFLLSIPVILASGSLEGWHLYRSPEAVAKPWWLIAVCMAVSFLLALAVIHLFLKYIARSGLGLFVAYRLVLGGVLLYLCYSAA